MCICTVRPKSQEQRGGAELARSRWGCAFAQLRSTCEPEPLPPRNGAKLSIATRLIGCRGRISSIETRPIFDVCVDQAAALLSHHITGRRRGEKTNQCIQSTWCWCVQCWCPSLVRRARGRSNI